MRKFPGVIFLPTWAWPHQQTPQLLHKQLASQPMDCPSIRLLETSMQSPNATKGSPAISQTSAAAYMVDSLQLIYEHLSVSSLPANCSQHDT